MQRAFSNSVIGLSAIGCLGVAAVALMRQSERFQDLTALLIYVVAPLALAAGLFACLLLSRELRLRA